jgi:sigma-B regulation protein RsbU (phosphoserine phosphatase)
MPRPIDTSDERMTDLTVLTASALDIGSLLELSRLLNDSDDAEFIYNNILLSLMGKLGFGRAAIATDAGEETFSVTITKGGARNLRGFEIRWDRKLGKGLFPVDLIDGEVGEALREHGIRYLMPINAARETIAVALLGGLLAPRELTPAEVSYAMLGGAIASMALEGIRNRHSLQETNRRLARRVHRLRSLFDAGREFNLLFDRHAILRLLGYTLMGEMAIARFAMILCDRSGWEVAVNRFRENLPMETLLALPHNEPLDLTSPESLTPDRQRLRQIGVVASIPLQLQGEIRGLLLVGQRLNFSLDDEDIEYLSLLGNLAMISLENTRLLEEMIEKKRLEEDLRIAAQIQQGLLPKALPKPEGFEIAAVTIPSQQVGGDCYDVIDLGGGRILLSVADVSGKGTPASLLMANVQAALRALSRLDLPLADMTARINDVIYENTSSDKFITAFFGILDITTGSFTYVNAGHNPPYHFSDAGVEALEAGGLILGVIPTMIPYDVGTVRLAPGDLLVLYTDGVSEALDPERQEYGVERLCALFDQDRQVSAVDAIERAKADLTRFARGASQSDDITLVVVRRAPSEEGDVEIAGAQSTETADANER